MTQPSPLHITVVQRVLDASRPPEDPTTQALRARGHQVRQVDEGDLDLDTDVVLLLRNAVWYRHACRRLARTPASKRPLVVVWHREPLPPPRAARLPRPRLDHRELAKVVLRDRRITDVYSNARQIMRLARHELPDVLVASTRARQEYLRERGLPAHWAPLGWMPGAERELGLERDIDALFIGALDPPRRRRKIAGLRRAGLDLMAVGDWRNPAYFGEGRARLLNRAKILVNVARHRGDLADDRFLLGMAYGALVISEPVYRPEPFEPGRHYVSTTLEEMPEVVDHYLRQYEERRRIVNQGRHFALTEYTMDVAIDRVLGFVAEALQARRHPL